MEKLIIPFNGNTKEQIENQKDNLFKEVMTWEVVLSMLEKVIHLRPWDQIDGLILMKPVLKLRSAKREDAKQNKILNTMKNILTTIAFYLLLPVAGIAYLLFDNFLIIRGKYYKWKLRKSGRVTKHNPFCDKW